MQKIFRNIAQTLQNTTIIKVGGKKQLEIVCKKLSQQRTLLIIDNLETLDSRDKEEVLSFLANISLSTKAIITTRDQVGLFSSIRLDKLSKEESFELIEEKAEYKKINITDDQKEKIYERFGGIPAALIYAVGRRAMGYSLKVVLGLSQPLDKFREDAVSLSFESSIILIRQQPAHNLLLSLAIFQDAPIKDALTVVAGLQNKPTSVEKALLQLQTMSLVQKKEGRYYTLATTREYLLAELAKYPDFEEQARERWIQWYLKFTQKYGGKDWQNWREQYDYLDRERENIVSVLYWCSSQDLYQEAQKLWRNIDSYVDLDGYWQTRRYWWKWLIKESERRADLPTYVQAITERAWTLTLMGENNLSEAAHEFAKVFKLHEFAELEIQSRLFCYIAVHRYSNTIIGYVRVSTELESQDSSQIRQSATLKKLGVETIVVERESGRNSDRPFYQEILRLIRLGKVKKIIATRSDRISRDQSELRYFYRLCMEQGVDWVFAEQPELNSDSPIAEELRLQNAYYAQLESERLGRRQERAYAFAREQGTFNTRVHPLGYRINRETKLYEIDWAKSDGSNIIGYLEISELQTLSDLYQLDLNFVKGDGSIPLAKGELAILLRDCFLSQQSQYKALKVWKGEILDKLNPIKDSKTLTKILKFTDNSLRDWLLNPILQGHTAYNKYKKVYLGEKYEKTAYRKNPRENWKITYNTHPNEAILNHNQAQTIEFYIEQNASYGYRVARSKRKSDLPESLSMILRCKHCGLGFKISTNYQKGKRYALYYCQGRYRSHCQGAGISEKNLVKQLIPQITAQAEILAQQISDTLSGEVKVTPAKLTLLEEESKIAWKKYQNLGMSEFLILHKKFEAEIARLKNAIAKEQETLIDQKKLIFALASADFWQQMNEVELNRYLREIVKVCWIENKTVRSVVLRI